MKFEKYKDNVGQWRWRYIASNGKTIGVSSESYWNESDCDHSIALMKQCFSAPVYRV